ncbi:hypothetical protein CH289_07885 [Rhodococcus sp. RS1C4]|nr:hypothetical protein [Rhodococcus sp. RS1C4]OZC55102.1 hypothetical protein CH289_07885 [Rhodococcus sp. RS1C4]
MSFYPPTVDITNPNDPTEADERQWEQERLEDEDGIPQLLSEYDAREAALEDEAYAVNALLDGNKQPFLAYRNYWWHTTGAA